MRQAGGLLLLCLFQALPLCAQFSGRVTGSVVDASGAAVPGAEVDLILAGGRKPLLSVKTSVEGLYHFIGVRPADYDLTVTAQGFVKTTVRNITVDAAREASVPDIKLTVASVTQSVDVTESAETVDVANAEISGTITAEEIRSLPIIDRDVLSVLQTQPGVASNGNSTTVINGLRTSYSNVTLDGINIQDNYIRDNALDYSPNKLLMGQVRQMTLISSNANAAATGGATETAFSTPSGTNQFHGEAFWYNRNNAFSANDWFNNQAGIPNTFLNQNQFGGSVGGPIKKDKLFFYSNYEAVRVHQQAPANTTILTAPARNGIFRYYDSAGTLHSVDLLALRKISISPVMAQLLAQVPGPEHINNNDLGDALNTAGYRFNQRDNQTRDNVTGKIDYNISTTHATSVAYLWNRDNLDRPDSENDYSPSPKAYNLNHSNFVATSWRWTPSAHITNEVRAGFNLTYGYFFTNQQFGPYFFTGMAYSDPVNEFMPQGRNTNTFSLSDDAAYQHGRHYIQFGFHGQNIRVRSYDAAGTVPTYNLAMGSGQPALNRNSLPGATSSTVVDDANTLLATLGGYIDSYSQTLNVTSRTSGFVPGAPFVRHFRLNDYDLYLQDKWKVAPRLTVSLGLRWQLPGVADERDSLEVEPVIQGTLGQTLLTNATLDFAGNSVGRPWYNRRWKDFAPNVGFAWDVFGDGKTALRGGYAVSYVNDQELLAPENMLEANGGVQFPDSAVGLSSRADSLPPIVYPTYHVPLKAADNYKFNPFSVIGSVDPNLNRPHVQQYSIGIQHEFKGTVLEARYVGNHVVGAYRAFDFNQVQVRENGFLADFLRAQNNGYLALAAIGTFNPNYIASIPGSQQLTIFPLLTKRGSFNDANVLNYLEKGEPGELATYYQTNGLNSSFNFFANPNALAGDMLTNYSSSSYNSLQLVARHRTRSGLSLEANYTFSKVLSDGDGDLQTRFQAFLDFQNPSLERSRANFDLNHMIKADGYYDLPLGEGHRLSFHPVVNRIVGGWRVGSTMVWQSGAPITILSGRGTLNREARSYYNTAVTSLNKSQLEQVVRFQMTGNGPVIVAPSAINPADGTGVSTDGPGVQPFAGQVFFNPTAGNLGTLQRRFFSGPWTFDLDLSLMKAVKIAEHQELELRMEAFNALNHATFWSGDQYINSELPGQTGVFPFGKITSMFYDPRRLQFGLTFRF